MSYTLEKKVTKAYSPRASGSTNLASDTLDLVYLKYKTSRTPPKDTVRINLVFAHGTGMNKSIWKYHIDKLFTLSSNSSWFLDSVVSVDAVGHGDSARVNDGKLGPIAYWEEGGKDLLEVIKNEQKSGDFYNNFQSRNILIGHSAGGHQAFMAGFHDPNLVDSVVPIEAVLYTHEKYIDKFIKIFTKISVMIIDEFDSIDDFDEYFQSFSFFKTLDPKILRDFMDDELYITTNDDGEIKYKAKSNKFNQMATYLSAGFSLKSAVPCLDLIRVPVCHVIATKGKWNPPDSIPYIREHIPKEFLVKTVDIPVGEHLTIAEHPEPTIELIEDFIKLRLESFKEVLKQDPELNLKGDRQKVHEAQYEALFEGKFKDKYYSKI